VSEISNSDFEFVREMLYKESAITLDQDMKYLVESRLTSLARKTDYDGLSALITALRSGKDATLSGKVVEAMTTNETSFFRDSHPFETLCKDVLPNLARSHNDTINIWCAACSTGQEPYTIAMAIHENCPARGKSVQSYEIW